MRRLVVHSKVSVLVVAAILAVTVSFALSGHPIALLWGLGATAFWLAPDLVQRWSRRPPSRATCFLVILVAGLVMSLAWPIARQNPDATYGGIDTPLRRNVLMQVLWASISCVGLSFIAFACLSVLVAMRRRRRRSSMPRDDHGD